MTSLNYLKPSLLAAALVAMQPLPAIAQTTTAVSGDLTYPDIVDLTIGAPTILRGTVERMKRLRGADAAGVAPGHERYLMEVTVSGLLVSGSPVPAEIRYLWDAPLDARGRAPKLKGEQVMLYLRPVPNRDDQFTLSRPEAQFAWSQSLEDRTRKVLSDLRAGGRADMRVARVGKAFHVDGSIPGESESQIFLITESGKPVSLVVLTRPNQLKQVRAAFGDVIDDAAVEISKETPLWYYLACGLPQELPASSVEDLTPEARAMLEIDYRFVLAELGRCERTLPE